MKIKSTPILFQSDMIVALRRAIDPKTQTRRIIKPEPIGFPTEMSGNLWHDKRSKGDPVMVAHSVPFKCPYGAAGDELWVKETFSRDAISMYPCPPAWYRATDDIASSDGIHTCAKKSRGNYADCLACWEQREGRKFKWTPSIFCTREASRTTLHIERIRAERVADISEADARAEGIQPFTKDDKLFKYWWCDPSERGTPKSSYTTWQDMPHTAVEAYRKLWNSINAHPKPMMMRDADGKNVINHYVAYPWCILDMRHIQGVTDIATSHDTASYRGKEVFIQPNPYVWAITFRKK